MAKIKNTDEYEEEMVYRDHWEESLRQENEVLRERNMRLEETQRQHEGKTK